MNHTLGSKKAKQTLLQGAGRLQKEGHLSLALGDDTVYNTKVLEEGCLVVHWFAEIHLANAKGRV